MRNCLTISTNYEKSNNKSKTDIFDSFLFLFHFEIFSYKTNQGKESHVLRGVKEQRGKRTS